MRATVQSWDVGNIPAHRLERHIISGIKLGSIGYGHTHFDTQLQIALYTVLGLSIDDYDVDAAALSEFVQRLQGGQPQLHPVLDLFANNLRKMTDFFNLYSATTIVTDSINFVNCTLFERHLKEMPLSPAASQYPLYKRARNGLGEVFAAYIWDKFSFPDVSTHIQAIPYASTVLYCPELHWLMGIAEKPSLF